jgi:alkylhydroperoxidase family enzyme
MTSIVASASPSSAGESRFAALTDSEAWARIPTPTSGGGSGPLPHWARVLAKDLPKTAGALLQLDYAQRVSSPVEPKLRAAMRLVAAVANESIYSQNVAEADAKQAGLDGARIAASKKGDFSSWSDAEKAALTFARKMSVESDQVSDDEFARLVKDFGGNQAASMVLAMAYANFMDRLTISLGCEVEVEGPIAPIAVSFDREKLASKPAVAKKDRPKIDDLPAPIGKDLVADDDDWATMTYEKLQNLLDIQKKKPTRLRIPEWSEVEKNLPAGLMKKPSDVVWYRITFAYAPELAIPFEIFMRTAGGEAGPKWDRIFGSSLFWVTTKAMKCPYCMGHCEMNWEVAGLSKDQIAQRSRLLSSDDWSSFPPAQQHAFAYARKITRSPGKIDNADIESLKQGFGPEVALLVVLNATRYHYMTRISNGFQLKLEDENVFYDYYDVKPPASGNQAAVTPLTNEEAWAKLPKAETGSGKPLPVWARAVAVQLPRTAAAMLETDLAHRTKSPLPAALRAKMRWVVADSNRCEYSKAYVVADLKRLGVTDEDIAALTASPDKWNDQDREALSFARQLTTNAPAIPDSLFASLRDKFGDKGVASMVLLAAFGNFQDRIVLGLNLPLEEGGPLAPVEVKFAPGAFQSKPVLPESEDTAPLLTRGKTVVETDPDWSDLSYDTLQTRLESQRDRKPRLPVPTWDEVKKKLPPEFASRPTRIVWNLVCSGYVPELAVPWSVSTRTMWSEAGQDRVFEESLFWVQTRAVKCNYCMGHCEMLLEVAGLDKQGIAQRTRMLAGDDWSAFPPEQQRAFAYARKLSKTPWEMTPEEFKVMEKDLGEKEAMAIFWWLCRGLYMTRVSDGFQLPLERDNVFADFFKKSTETKSDSTGSPAKTN